MYSATLAIWDHACLVKDPQITSPEQIPKQLEGYAHFSPKVGGCIYGLSKKNLWRIYNYYGKIPVVGGQQRLDDFKYRVGRFQEMVKAAVFIKTGAYDVRFDDGYEYRAPPLAPYQDIASRLLASVDRVPLFADCGCISGDTIIPWSKGGAGKKTTLKEFYRYFHSKHGRRSIDPKVRSFDGERIRLHGIRNVIESGIKDTYQLTLADGKTIRATADHEILTRAGWAPVSMLRPGTPVMVDGLTKHQEKSPEDRSKRTKGGDARVAVGSYHPYARKQSSHGGRSCSYLIELHRAIYEASVNKLTLEEFIGATYQNQERCSTLFFMDPATYAIHHRNGDHYDNRPENLEMLDKREHRKHHTAGYSGYSHFGHGQPSYADVASVAYMGPEMTYDIVCDDPHRNFVANGIVVHNCGKTWAALTAIERRMSTLNIMPGKVLICGKLMTLETGWMEDCLKFTNLKPVMLWMGPKKNRRERLIELLNTPADIYITNHDTVRILEEELTMKRFQGVIVDESTILKSFRSAKAKGGAFGKALMGVSRFAHWRVIMSGTPAPNGADDLFGQFHFLDPDGNTLEASYSDFKESFMECIKFGSKTKAATEESETNEDGTPAKKKFDPVKWFVPKDKSVEIHNLISPLTFRVKIRDHLKDLPEMTIMKRVVSMTPEQARHYANMKETLSTIINDERISVSIKLTQLMKLRQITSGLLIDEQEKAHYLPDNPKLEMIDQLLNEEIDVCEKVIIYGQYQAEIEQLVSRYKDRGIVSAYGGNSTNTNLANIKAFIHDPDVKTIVLHPKAAAHGITFTCSHYMIMASSSYSNEENYQAVKRIERASQRHAMFVWYLLCKGSIDEAIWNVLVLKQKNQEELIDQDESALLTEALRL